VHKGVRIVQQRRRTFDHKSRSARPSSNFLYFRRREAIQRPRLLAYHRSGKPALEKRMNKTDDPGLLADAIIASDAMEQTARYLQGGRYLGSLTIDQMKDVWTAAFKAWFISRSDEDARKMDDAGAELGLRNEQPPFETVQAEASAMIEEIERGPNNPKIGEKVQHFREDLEKPRN
jgi:hypothetical protein